MRIEAGRRQRGDRARGRLGKDERERPRPKCFGEPRHIGIEARQRLRRFEVADMGDERIERRAALGLIEARDGAPVGRVGAEAVDRLGRKRDEAAGGKHARRVRNRCGIGPCNARRRRGCHGSPRVPR